MGEQEGEDGADGERAQDSRTHDSLLRLPGGWASDRTQRSTRVALYEAAVSQAARHTRHRASGSDNGSPWTQQKSAGPPSRMTPASASPMSSPPRQVAAASAVTGSIPAVTRLVTSHASRLARSEPPPKSLPVAIATPASRAVRTDASPCSRRAAVAATPAAPAKRSMLVVAPKLSHEPMTARVLTRVVPR